MNHLLRELAPISESGWQLLDREAKDRLAPALAARRLVDFSGPHGWEHSATNLGRTAPLKATAVKGITALQRRVLALVELRASFELPLAELRDADRGADDADLTALDAAALVVLGRLGHEAHPNPGRKRLVVTSRVAWLERDPADENAMLWNPGGIGFSRVLAGLGIADGVVAVTGWAGSSATFSGARG